MSKIRQSIEYIKLLNRLQQASKNFPSELGNISLKFFQERFRKSNWCLSVGINIENQ